MELSPLCSLLSAVGESIIPFSDRPSGSGAGLNIFTPLDVQPAAACNTTVPSYYPFAFANRILLQDSVVANNSASCATCSGGGVSLGPGGNVTVAGCVITNNSATVFGGGLLFGDLQSTTTCAVLFQDSVIATNRAGKGGAQLYSTCAGNGDMVNVSVAMVLGQSQVRCTAPV